LVRFSLRTHPEVVFAYRSNHSELILRVDNPADKPVWAEAEVTVPEQLSLAPDHHLPKGRMRVGIIGKKEYLEKSVRVYANSYTQPQMYTCNLTIFVFNHDGVIDQRMEKSMDIRCELKKEPKV